MGVQAFLPPSSPFPLPSIPSPPFLPPYCVSIITFTSPLTTDTWTPTHNIFPLACFVWCTSCMSSPNLLLPPSHIFTGITLSPSNLSYHPFHKINLSPHPHSPPLSHLAYTFPHYSSILFLPVHVPWWLFLQGVHHTLHVQHLNPTPLSTTPSGHHNFTNGLSSHWDQ